MFDDSISDTQISLENNTLTYEDLTSDAKKIPPNENCRIYFERSSSIDHSESLTKSSFVPFMSSHNDSIPNHYGDTHCQAKRSLFRRVTSLTSTQTRLQKLHLFSSSVEIPDVENNECPDQIERHTNGLCQQRNPGGRMASLTHTLKRRPSSTERVKVPSSRRSTFEDNELSVRFRFLLAKCQPSFTDSYIALNKSSNIPKSSVSVKAPRF
ncbi:unnamed protein product [Protopolystoma xenopodis]|uniref:Uncharacterized protein n=1 Tax=Protopolystoma xenopodis TaxID=117903 RepID=A0A3S4ZF10_9PLAT|nr:unnamed protein product [Protopolystoma xenopodis]